MPGFIVQNIGGTIGTLNADANREYLYKYSWTIENLFISGANVAPFTNGGHPEIQLKDATLPTFTANKEIVMGGSMEYKFAKSVTFDDIKVTWYDTIGMLQVMQAWRALVWTPTEGLQVARQYKHRSQIAHYAPHDPSNKNTHVLFNSWPSVIRHGELTYTESDVNLVEVTITYDWSEAYNLSGIHLGTIGVI